MTTPAEITTEQTWDRLVAALRTQYRQIDDLYQRITEPDDAPTAEDTVTNPDADIDTGYDPDLQAELEDERLTRLDLETDGELDGNYDPEPHDDPDLDT